MDPKPHILAVEDVEISRQYLTYHLEHAGFQVTTVADGEEMLAAIEADQFDLILLDLGLPDGDGLSRAQQVREHSDVPIIVLTARQGADDRLMALSLGADDYLTKPCDPRELVLRIRNILVRGGVPCAPCAPCAPDRVPTPHLPMPKPKPQPPARRVGTVVTLLLVAAALVAGAAGTAWWINAKRETAATAPAQPERSPDASAASTPQPPAVSETAQQHDASPAERELEVTVTAQPRPPATTPAPGPAAGSATPPSATAQTDGGYATAAKSYSWVLKSKCPALPQGDHWQVKKHTELVRLVNRLHGGDWQTYMSSWVDRLAQLQDIHSRGSGVKLGSGEVMAGDKLRAYIEETQKRLDVTLCLSREAADFAHRKSLIQR